MDPVTHEHGVKEVQIGSQRVRKVHEHLLSGFSLLHIFISRVMLYYLVHLLEAVSRERGVLAVQIGYQRVRQVHAHLLSGLSLLHHVYLTSYACD